MQQLPMPSIAYVLLTNDGFFFKARFSEGIGDPAEFGGFLLSTDLFEQTGYFLDSIVSFLHIFVDGTLISLASKPRIIRLNPQWTLRER